MFYTRLTYFVTHARKNTKECFKIPLLSWRLRHPLTLNIRSKMNPCHSKRTFFHTQNFARHFEFPELILIRVSEAITLLIREMPQKWDSYLSIGNIPLGERRSPISVLILRLISLQCFVFGLIGALDRQLRVINYDE